jgi:hypothetical protein
MEGGGVLSCDIAASESLAAWSCTTAIEGYDAGVPRRQWGLSRTDVVATGGLSWCYVAPELDGWKVESSIRQGRRRPKRI